MDNHKQTKQGSHSYLLNPESASEMARLILLDRFTTEAMGGPLAEQEEPSLFKRVLDIGCGPGGWVMTTAQAFPHMKVTGIDVSTLMVSFAKSEAMRTNTENIRFEVMNALEPFDFPDSSFDLVNLRYGFSWIPRTNWPVLLQEAFRVLRTGGVMRLTEGDTGGISNSAAFSKIMHLCNRLVHTMKYGFSPDGYSAGMTPMMGKLFSDAGFVNTQYRPHVLDFSYGTLAYEGQKQEYLIGFKGFEPVLIQAGLATQVEMNRLHAAFVGEINSADFRALTYLLTMWGRKP